MNGLDLPLSLIPYLYELKYPLKVLAITFCPFQLCERSGLENSVSSSTKDDSPTWSTPRFLKELSKESRVFLLVKKGPSSIMRSLCSCKANTRNQ